MQTTPSWQNIKLFKQGTAISFCFSVRIVVFTKNLWCKQDTVHDNDKQGLQTKKMLTGIRKQTSLSWIRKFKLEVPV